MAEDDEWRAIGDRLRRTRLIAGMSRAESGKQAGLISLAGLPADDA